MDPNGIILNIVTMSKQIPKLQIKNNNHLNTMFLKKLENLFLFSFRPYFSCLIDLK